MGANQKLGTAVQLMLLLRLGVRNVRTVFAITDCPHAIIGDAERSQIFLHRKASAFGQGTVVFVATTLVTMAFNDDA